MKSFPVHEGVPGFRFAGIASGLKPNRAKDLGLILSAAPCAAAGAFTRNRVKAAPLIICRKRVRSGMLQAVLVNSGNANACTGEQGLQDALETCDSLSAHLGIKPSLVVPCSTGVIGVRLPVSRVLQALPGLVGQAARDRMNDFATAIMTTDRYPKIVALKETIDGHALKVCGIAKGAGMIMPDMATMLVFIVTNASIEHGLLSGLVSRQVSETFNRITVDGDTSTNDTVLVLANGQSHRPIASRHARGYAAFSALLQTAMHELSLKIVQDGEGATKLIAVSVINARTRNDAHKAARRVANSCLVKTAFFGQDFNWGRIMAAIGSSGAMLDMHRVDISFNGIPGVRSGLGVNANRARLKKTIKQERVDVTIDLKQGRHSCRIFTCDLSYDYVKINASYTT
jgi:glutamate N-acetyltransferase/amino-acid N-acetyltransferase